MKLINPEVRIENTNYCNSKCVICPREKMTRQKTIMPMDHFAYLAKQAKDLGAKTISVFGFGEPLIDNEIVEKIRLCKELDLKTFITTNGSLLSMQMAFDLLKAGLTDIRFSVHGVWDNYESVHKGLKFDKLERNLANFRAIRDKRYPFCKISISVIPMNGEKVEDIKERWKDFDLEIWKPHNWVGGREYRNVTNKRKKTCGRPQSGPVQIQADGKVIPCCFITNGEIILGDTYKNTIDQILKSDPYERLREKHNTGDLAGLVCETCDQLNIGDSPLLFSSIDPTLEAGKTSSTKFKLKEK